MARNYKSKKKIPLELEEFLDSLNLLPSDTDDFEKQMKKLGNGFVKEAFIKMEDKFEFMNHVSDVMESYSNELRQLVSPGIWEKFCEDRSDFREQRIILSDLNEEKATLKQIIFGYRGFRKNKNYFFGGDFKKPLQRYTFNEDSTLVVSGIKIIEILIRNNVPVERLGFCSLCKKFFWAKKITAKTCGETKCVEAVSGKKYYEINKEKINEKRRKEYQKEREELEKERKRKEWLNQDFSKKD